MDMNLPCIRLHSREDSCRNMHSNIYFGIVLCKGNMKTSLAQEFRGLELGTKETAKGGGGVGG